MQGVTFGAICEGNIVSGAMLTDDLGFPEHRHGSGFKFGCDRVKYQDDQYYTQQNNAFRGNIAYRTGAGISLGGDWTGVKGNVVEDNVFVADTPVNDEDRESHRLVPTGGPQQSLLRQRRTSCRPVAGQGQHGATVCESRRNGGLARPGPHAEALRTGGAQPHAARLVG